MSWRAFVRILTFVVGFCPRTITSPPPHHFHTSVQCLDRLGRRRDMKDDSARILFHPFLRTALVSSSRMGRDVHALMMSNQHFLRRPQRRSVSKVHWRMDSERLSWRVTCPTQASFRLMTVARSGSCGPTRKLILVRTQSLVLCSKYEMRRSLLRHLVSKAWIFLFQS